jgi:hypothetical protein
MRRPGIAWLVLAFCLAGPGLCADEVDELIDSVKPSPVDHAAWAAKLLDAADSLGDKPEAKARICEAAYEHGMKAAKGYPTAIRVGRAMMDASPKDKGAWQAKVLAALKQDCSAARPGQVDAAKLYLYELVAAGDDLAEAGDAVQAGTMYATAAGMVGRCAPTMKDEIASKAQAARDRERVRREVEQGQRLLAANPKNVTARESLIRLQVVELASPAEAEKLLTSDVSEELRTCVPLAAKDRQELAKEACVQLGEWYMSLAKARNVTGAGLASALTCARDYYGQFLRRETAALKVAMVTAKLAEIETKLKGSSDTAAGPWVDVLARKDRFALSQAKAVPEGYALGNLETVGDVKVPFTAEFIAKTDSNNIRMGFRGRESVIFNWEADQDQLRIADLADGAERGYKGKGRVPTNQWVRIVWDVTDTQMGVTVDGQSRVVVAGKYKGLSGKVRIFSSHGSVVTVNSFRLRGG